MLITIPGIKNETAAVIIAEIVIDMAQFPQHSTWLHGLAYHLEVMKAQGNGQVHVLSKGNRILNPPCVKLHGPSQDVRIGGWQLNIRRSHQEGAIKKYSLRCRIDAWNHLLHANYQGAFQKTTS